ncbi:hypothetical protein KT71_000147 [Congregibacter litoralis KT71]|uniref:Uncharacterized protein n=1 Tax=Congregibacter litoralis KT71 TaxID=314285 RepID=V7HT20_9GAMM|nr:hypothetical protein KT71_000147 [Congregibacter litoralis KT71]
MVAPHFAERDFIPEAPLGSKQKAQGDKGCSRASETVLRRQVCADSPLQQPGFGKGVRPAPADDKMVQNADIHQSEGVPETLGDMAIGA